MLWTPSWNDQEIPALLIGCRLRSKSRRAAKLHLSWLYTTTLTKSEVCTVYCFDRAFSCMGRFALSGVLKGFQCIWRGEGGSFFMLIKPARLCRNPHCPNLTTDPSGYCPVHRPVSLIIPGTSLNRKSSFLACGYGYDRRKIREGVLTRAGIPECQWRFYDVDPKREPDYRRYTFIPRLHGELSHKTNKEHGGFDAERWGRLFLRTPKPRPGGVSQRKRPPVFRGVCWIIIRAPRETGFHEVPKRDHSERECFYVSKMQGVSNLCKSHAYTVTAPQALTLRIQGVRGYKPEKGSQKCHLLALRGLKEA